MQEENLPKYRIAIVAPVHIQPTKEWILSLQSAAKEHTVIIIHDSWKEKVDLPSEWDVYDYTRQEEVLGSELFEQSKVFHKSSAIRNIGHWIAYKQGFDIIIGLDSDCNVPPDFVSKHLENLMNNSYGWENPIKDTSWFPRGYPYHERMRKTVLSMGLWENELDINGRDRVKRGQPPYDPGITKQQIAHGLIPLCGMNFAMWAYALPAFLFLPNIDDGDIKIRRYDDIWGGYIFQKIMQLNKEMISYGYPIVLHDTIVDAEADADLEKDGISLEEQFYTTVDIAMDSVDTPGDYQQMFSQMIGHGIWEQNLFKEYLPTFNMWVTLFKPNGPKS